jgi:putative tryptophan/tyrosine transport system substrate-binding protein
MRRREFIGGVAAAAVVGPRGAWGQQTRVVGVLMNGNSNELPLQGNVTAFTERLRDLGWIQERNLRLETRWNGGNAERARAFASELVALSPAAIVSSSTTNLLALKNTTNVIPIVFLQVSDPVVQGFSSMTKPGGNATGFSPYEFSIGGKWLELLKQIAPGLERVAVMSNPDTSPQTKFFIASIEAAAARFNMSVEAAPVRTMEDIEHAIAKVSGRPNGSIVIPTDSYTRTRGERIAALAFQARIPVIAAFSEFIDQGGLMFYGPSTNENMADQFRDAASYVDRILKGTKPGDLPVQSATKFSLFINRKTASAFGLEIPARLLFTADQVIE